MDLVLLILAILYLCGCKVGTGLAICTIIEVILLTVIKVCKEWK